MLNIVATFEHPKLGNLFYIVAFRAVTRQRPRDKQICQNRYWATLANKHVSTVTNQHATIEELLETVFSTVVRADDL
jgi:hypothetical protein